MAATNEEQRAKLECARLLHETVHAKQAKFAVSGKAENIEREHVAHEFPTLPGLRIESAAGIAGIDPGVSLPLPLSKENGELFFGGNVSSPRLTADEDAAAVAANAAAAASAFADRDVAVLSGNANSFSITNPQWHSAVRHLAVHVTKEMGIESGYDARQSVEKPTMSDVEVKNPKLLICRPSATLSTEHYQHAANNDSGYTFASLLIQLPSDLSRTVGGFCVSYNGIETMHDMGVSPYYYEHMAPHACHYLCHMRQCQARTGTVPSNDNSCGGGGYRVILAYDIEWWAGTSSLSRSARYCGKVGPYPTLPPPTDTTLIRNALQKLAPSDRVFISPLGNLYDRKKVEGSGINALSPRDAAFIRTIERASGIGMWEFRILLFDRYDSTRYSSRPVAFWYDDDGALIHNKDDYPMVNWSICNRGGNAISEDAGYLSKMIGREMCENDMSAAIVAYDGGSSTEINATGKFEEAVKRCREGDRPSVQKALDALCVNGVRPSVSSLVDFLGRLPTAAALLTFYEISTKRQMMQDDELIETFIESSGIEIGLSFRKLMRNVLTTSGSFGEHFLDIVQFSSSIDDDEQIDFFKHSMKFFIEDSDPPKAKYFAEYIAKEDTITQVRVIMTLPSQEASSQGFGDKLQTIQDELRKALKKGVMETMGVLFVEDRSKYKRRHLFDTEQGRITIDKDTLDVFFFVAGKDVLTRLSGWASTASYDDLYDLIFCFPSVGTPLPIASALHLDESRSAIKSILENFLLKHRQKKITEPTCTDSLRMPRAKHCNKKVQAFLRSEAKIGYVAAESRGDAKELVQSITGNNKDDETILKEGYSAIALRNHQRNKFSVKIEKIGRLRELEVDHDFEWKGYLDCAQAYLAKLTKDVECCREPKQKKPRM